jgi:hypothetical protein
MHRVTRPIIPIMALLPLATVGLLVGCGDSGSGNSMPKAQPADPFIGLWEIAANTSTFVLNCTDPMDSNLTSQNALIFVELRFERGAVTDLAETSRSCFSGAFAPGLNYNVNGTVASVASPDPDTSSPPVCTFAVSDGAGGIAALLDIQPPADPTMWSFTISPGTAGSPPTGTLKGQATVIPSLNDGTGNFVAQPACTYSGHDPYFQVSKL